MMALRPLTSTESSMLKPALKGTVFLSFEGSDGPAALPHMVLPPRDGYDPDRVFGVNRIRRESARTRPSDAVAAPRIGRMRKETVVFSAFMERQTYRQAVSRLVFCAGDAAGKRNG